MDGVVIVFYFNIILYIINIFIYLYLLKIKKYNKFLVI